MARKFKTIFTTERSAFHQEKALQAAPPELEIVMLRQPDETELRQHFAGTSYFISERAGEISADMIAAMPDLKLILRLGSLTHDIDINAAKDAGVIVCYQPISSVIRVAEHVVMQMLTLSKKLYEVGEIARSASDEWRESRRTDENTFAYNWSNRQGIGQIYQQTVGILGFGEIGAELARRLSGWGCNILYNKRRRLPRSVERELNITYAKHDDLITQSDYLVNLLPYHPETERSLNAETFAAMKAGAFLVSVGSGSVIDEVALADAITSGKLASAALDTYEWEPIKPDNPLIALAKSGYNIILTPHTAAGSFTPTSAKAECRADYRAIVAHLNGAPIPNRLA